MTRLVNPNQATHKIIVSLDDASLARIDAHALENGSNRSAALRYLLKSSTNSQHSHTPAPTPSAPTATKSAPANTASLPEDLKTRLDAIAFDNDELFDDVLVSVLRTGLAKRDAPSEPAEVKGPKGPVIHLNELQIPIMKDLQERMKVSSFTAVFTHMLQIHRLAEAPFRTIFTEAIRIAKERGEIQ